MFTTHTKLNRGLRLRLQRGPELVSPVAVLRLRKIVVALHWHHTLHVRVIVVAVAPLPRCAPARSPQRLEMWKRSDMRA